MSPIRIKKNLSNLHPDFSPGSLPAPVPLLTRVSVGSEGKEICCRLVRIFVSSEVLFFGCLFRTSALSDMSNGAFQASHTHLADLSSSERVSASL